MRLIPSSKSSLLVASVGALLFSYWCWTGTLSFLKRRRRKQRETALRVDDLWNTVMFFPNYFPENENVDSTARQLTWYLEEAAETIDICVFCLNFKMFEEALIRQASKGVRIRILTNGYVSRRMKMRRVGIELRTKIHTWFSPISTEMGIDLMHHKFVIIDDRAILAGSLNWTASGISENFENFAVTTAPFIRRKFQTEFERLWEESGSWRGPHQRAIVDPGYLI